MNTYNYSCNDFRLYFMTIETTYNYVFDMPVFAGETLNFIIGKSGKESRAIQMYIVLKDKSMEDILVEAGGGFLKNVLYYKPMIKKLEVKLV